MLDIKQMPEFADILKNRDHLDVKTIETNANMSEFIAGMFNWKPLGLRILYGIRAGFVRLLGMRQPSHEGKGNLRPEDVPYNKGAALSFFTVYGAEKEKYFIAFAQEKHLIAYLALAAEPLENGRTRYHLATVVKYLHWTGPVYFNVIRPFHHLVVHFMAQAGARV